MASPSSVRVGGRYYVPYPDEVEQVQVVEKGDGGYNLKPGFRPRDPVVVMSIAGTDVGREYVVSARKLYSDPLAAAIVSDEMSREADKD